MILFNSAITHTHTHGLYKGIFRNQKKIIMGRKEGNVLFNDTLNTFYLRLYGVRHMVKGGNSITQIAFVTAVVDHWLEQDTHYEDNELIHCYFHQPLKQIVSHVCEGTYRP